MPTFSITQYLPKYLRFNYPIKIKPRYRKLCIDFSLNISMVGIEQKSMDGDKEVAKDLNDLF